MNLYLIRHADAVPREEHPEEETRPLTDKGWAEAKQIAAMLQAHEITLDAVLTSPLVRARQTAEEMLKHIPSPVPPLTECLELAPGGRFKKLLRTVAELGVENVGLVGHMPDLGELTGWLIGSRKSQIDLAKAGVARVLYKGVLRKGRGVLVWVVTPEWYPH